MRSEQATFYNELIRLRYQVGESEARRRAYRSSMAVRKSDLERKAASRAANIETPTE